MHLFVIALLAVLGTSPSFSATVPSTPAPVLALAQPEPAPCTAPAPHLRLVVLQDLTTSSRATLTPRLTVGELRHLATRVRERCGSAEVAFGTIRDRAETSLKRLSLDAPPMGPVTVAPPRNPYAASVAAGRYRTALSNYRTARGVWASDAEQRIARWLAEVTPLLMRVLAGSTEIFTLMRQVNTFMTEPLPWPGPVDKVLVVISDGDDRVGAGLPTFQADVRTVVVNGLGTPGIFMPLGPVTYGDPGAAFIYVLRGRSD